MLSLTVAAILGVLVAGAVWGMASRRFGEVIAPSRTIFLTLTVLLGLLVMWAAFAWLPIPQNFWWNNFR